MNCSLCSGIALRQVGRQGFCAAHLAEAWEAARKDNSRTESERAVTAYLPDGHFERQKRERAKENGWRGL